MAWLLNSSWKFCECTVLRLCGSVSSSEDLASLRAAAALDNLVRRRRASSMVVELWSVLVGGRTGPHCCLREGPLASCSGTHFGFVERNTDCMSAGFRANPWLHRNNVCHPLAGVADRWLSRLLTAVCVSFSVMSVWLIDGLID